MTENTKKRGTVADGMRRYLEKHGRDNYGRPVDRAWVVESDTAERSTEVMTGE